MPERDSHRDNATLARSLGDAHELCEQQRDVATANLIEGWVDDAQERVRFLRETNAGRALRRRLDGV